MTKNKKTTAARVKKPKNRVLRGSGDYQLDNYKQVVDAVRNIDKRVTSLDARPKVSDLAGKAARKLGAMVPIPGAGDLMGDAASGLAKYFGFGDYQIQQNSIMQGMAASHDGANTITQFSSHKRGLRIADREYIGDVFSGTVTSGSSIFSNVSYHINPGDSVCFPWLSTIAQNYEEWEPHGIVFEFRTTSSTYNGTSQALGTVIAATDYNANDATFANKIQMEQSDFANSGAACANLIHGVECAEGERPTKVLYVRQTPFAAASTDPRFTDLGNFQLATQGMSTAGVNLGELWISYDITLYKKATNFPKTYTSIFSTTGLNNANMFGTTPYAKSTGSLGCTFSANAITFPVGVTTGRYLIIINVVAASCTLSSLTGTTTGCTVVRQMSSNPAGTSAVTNIEVDIATNSLTPAVVDFTNTFAATTPTSTICCITPVSRTFDLAVNS
jgi:hypothetical protein